MTAVCARTIKHGMDMIVYVEIGHMGRTVSSVSSREYGILLLIDVYVRVSRFGMGRRVNVQRGCLGMIVCIVRLREYGMLEGGDVDVRRNRQGRGMELIVSVMRECLEMTVLSVDSLEHG